jgi:KaiC/GvpD/RAD55 family RecA-like ATPase
MKGAEARHALAGALSGNGQSLFVVTPPEGHKDASDMLQAGQSEELAKLVQFGKRPYSPEKVVGAGSISFEELIAPRPAGVFVDCFPQLMKKLNGFRLKELTMLLAPSNVGKSTVCSVLAHKFMQAGFKVGMIFLEEGNKETLQRMVAAELGVNYLKFMRNPTSVASEERIKDVYDDIVNNERLFLLDHFGSLPVDDLMNKIKHMVLVDGCKYIVLDHISAVISGLQDDNERKSLDVAMTNLASFCAANEVHLLVVTHINRTDSQQFLPPKGKEDQPFWVNVRKESARGSAALEQFSWNIIGLEPEIMPDFSRGRVRLKVLKTRFGDSLGIADVFTLDQETWEIVLDGELGF